MPSTVINSFNYDEVMQTLTINFTSGASYQYLGVMPDLVGRFARASSKGAFFTRNIRNTYPFMRMS